MNRYLVLLLVIPVSLVRVVKLQSLRLHGTRVKPDPEKLAALKNLRSVTLGKGGFTPDEQAGVPLLNRDATGAKDGRTCVAKYDEIGSC